MHIPMKAPTDSGRKAPGDSDPIRAVVPEDVGRRIVGAKRRLSSISKLSPLLSLDHLGSRFFFAHGLAV